MREEQVALPRSQSMRTCRRDTRWITVAIALSLLFTAGCPPQKRHAERLPQRGMRDFSSTRFNGTDVLTAHPAADRAFKGQAFRVDPSASSTDIWVSRPREIVDPDRLERIRDLLRGSTNRHRTVAELRLVQEGPNILALCRVQVQRLDTIERDVFARARDAGDHRRSETPVGSEGAGQAPSREEWVTVGRDRQTENLILEAIRRALDVD